MSNAQGALEYLLLIGGAVLVSVIVITLILGISDSQKDSVTATSQSAFDIIRVAREGIGRSEIVLVNSLSLGCVADQFASVTIYTPDNLDVSAFEEDDDTLGVVHLVGEIFLSNASVCYPKRFEYTKINNYQGFIIHLPVPVGGWKNGSNLVDVTITSGDYVNPELTSWNNMDRLQLYLNLNNLNQPTESITYKNMRLVKYD